MYHENILFPVTFFFLLIKVLKKKNLLLKLEKAVMEARDSQQRYTVRASFSSMELLHMCMIVDFWHL